MSTARVIELPDRVHAAAAAGTMVWCAAGGRLLGFTDGGDPQLDVALPGEVTQLAATSQGLVAVVSGGSIAWLDARDGRVLARQPGAASLELLQGGGAVWALDRQHGRAWRADEPGVRRADRRVPGVDRAAADGDRLWWTTEGDALLHDGERETDTGVDAGARGGMAVCAGSVWISVAGGLCRVGAWAAERGPLVAAPLGPIPFLVCAGGVLVGAATHDAVLVLDPSADADVRVIDVDTGGTVGALVAAGRTAWVCSGERPEARLVAF